MAHDPGPLDELADSILARTERDDFSGVVLVRRGDDVGGCRENIYSYPPIGDAAGGAQVTASDLISFLQAVRAGRQIWYGFGLEFDLDADGVASSYCTEGMNVGTRRLAG